MNAIRTRHLLGIFTVLMTLLVCFPTLTNSVKGAEYKKGFGSDIDPADLPKGFTWADNGIEQAFVSMNDKEEIVYHKIQTYASYKEFLATSPKVQSITGKKYARNYHEKKFTDDQQKDVSRFWKARFGASDKEPKTEVVIDDAGVDTNCFQYALSSRSKGNWERVVVQWSVTVPSGLPFPLHLDTIDIGAVPAVFNDTHQPVAKADAKAGDVILYVRHTEHGVPTEFVTHATVIEEVGPTPKLLFRYLSSPLFRYKVKAGESPLDSPMYYGPLEKRNEWVWNVNGAGSEAQLYKAPGGPANSVYRPKAPK